MSVYMPVCLNVCMLVYLCVYLSVKHLNWVDGYTIMKSREIGLLA